MFSLSAKLKPSEIRSSEKASFQRYFSEVIKKIYIFASVAIILGFSLDIYFYFNQFTFVAVLIKILVVVFISIISILGLYKNKIDSSFLIIMYLTILGFFSAYFYDVFNEVLMLNLFIRNIISFPLMILAVGIIVSRKQMIVVGILLAILFPLLMLASNNNLLIEVTPFITIKILIVKFALSALLSLMTKSIFENELKEKELLQQKLHLEEINRDKENLFSVISHDLRGPVGNAKQMMRYLKDNETTDDEKNFLIEAVNSSIANTFHLLDNLLLWAKNERGIVKFEPQNLNIYISVIEMISFVQRNADEKHINIENQIIDELISFSDKNLFETIIRNLLANAIKFTDDGGKIIVSSIEDNQVITISVKDNGVGMPLEIKEKVFSDFSISPAFGTKNEKGLGLV